MECEEEHWRCDVVNDSKNFPLEEVPLKIELYGDNNCTDKQKTITIDKVPYKKTEYVSHKNGGTIENLPSNYKLKQKGGNKGATYTCRKVMWTVYGGTESMANDAKWKQVCDSGCKSAGCACGRNEK